MQNRGGAGWFSWISRPSRRCLSRTFRMPMGSPSDRSPHPRSDSVKPVAGSIPRSIGTVSDVSFMFHYRFPLPMACIADFCGPLRNLQVASVMHGRSHRSARRGTSAHARERAVFSLLLLVLSLCTQLGRVHAGNQSRNSGVSGEPGGLPRIEDARRHHSPRRHDWDLRPDEAQTEPGGSRSSSCAGEKMQELIAAAGTSEDEIVADFKKLRRERRMQKS